MRIWRCVRRHSEGRCCAARSGNGYRRRSWPTGSRRLTSRHHGRDRGRVSMLHRTGGCETCALSQGCPQNLSTRGHAGDGLPHDTASAWRTVQGVRFNAFAFVSASVSRARGSVFRNWSPTFRDTSCKVLDLRSLPRSLLRAFVPFPSDTNHFSSAPRCVK